MSTAVADQEDEVFTISLDIDWEKQNGDGVQLLPDFEPVTISLSPTYDYLGLYDYDSALAEMGSQLEQAWGMRLDLQKQATPEGGVEESLRQILVEALIRQNPDVLREFSADAAALNREAWNGSLPLVMAGSGYKFSVNCSSEAGGSLDSTAIVEALEQAYGEVVQVPDGYVFSASQRSDLLVRASDWAQGMLAEAGLALPKVEVDLESGAWVGNSLRLWINLHKDQVVKYALLIPVGQGGELDFSNISQVAAEIAQDLSQSSNQERNEWLCARIVEQIEPDAREYAAWIIEVENNIRAEFWQAMNQELEGHLKKAKKLHEAAKKWRKDYDEWIKESGNAKAEVPQDTSETKVKFTYSLTELPGRLISDLKKIWEGLCALPGAVKKGVGDHSDELVDGAILGFRMAGVVIDKARSMAIRTVGMSTIIECGEYIAGELLKKNWAKNVGERRAQLRAYGYQLSTFVVGRVLVYYEVQRLQRQFPELARKVNQEILDTIKEVNLEKRGGKD